MDNKERNKALKILAKKHGMCEKVRKKWDKDWELETMIDQFYRNLDFYLKERYIPRESFKELFSQSWLRSNGVLVDDTYSLLNPKEAILIGESKSTVRYNGESISTLYIIDNAEAKVTARGNAFVIIHLLDSAKADVEQYDKAKITVILHSEDCLYISKDNIKVKQELDYLK